MPVFMGILLVTQSVLSGATMENAWKKTKRDYLELVVTAWECWIPVTMINFIFVPVQFRLLFVNIIQIGFGVFVSKIANKSMP